MVQMSEILGNSYLQPLCKYPLGKPDHLQCQMIVKDCTLGFLQSSGDDAGGFGEMSRVVVTS